jgi:hypothetical protein
LSISDVIGAWDNVTSFVPIDPKEIADPSDLRNDLVLEDQAGRTATASDAASIAAHDADGRHHQDYVQVDADSQADLDVQAARMLADRKADVVTWSATIGPLDEAALALIRPGDIMTVTSQVMGLTAAPRRIAQMTLSPVEGRIDRWSAALELSRPVRHGNKIPGLDAGGREGGRSVGGGGNSDPNLAPNRCNGCPPFTPTPAVYDFEAGVPGPVGGGLIQGFVERVWGDGYVIGPPGDHAFTDSATVFAQIRSYARGAPFDARRSEIELRTFSEWEAPGPEYTHARLRARIATESGVIPADAASYSWALARGAWPVGSVPGFDDVGATFVSGVTAPNTEGGPYTNTADVDEYLLVVEGHVEFALKFSGQTGLNAINAAFPHPGEPDDGVTPRYPDVDDEMASWQSGDVLLLFQTDHDGVGYSFQWYTVPLIAPASVPLSGQSILNERVSGVDGTATTFSTLYGAFMPGSLSVRVNGLPFGPSEIASQDPAAGSWTFRYPPRAGSDVTIDYRKA